ncbi:uncharacterized protein K460DRAFT_363467 [Cucurbitaria berberidis CBS 394.84]|uniref:Beta/gamma crystallin 'Greek key' domain-containing protein n=1 Tax=Cucurbitaria berberidis CBS 394.84 TaxID=1168544 RepID=A0A9P4GLQ7_9PLEO|nr:uncharacterized protein K460DRAFT_363467 [Cucurbitaria berberidis CBS 394.84]KAF1847391.1 hypothetical protein K460DRAFT_363467 [Cucurbitaria berberidis CBS 394.84]
MRFFALTAALIGAVSALPADAVHQSASNFLAPEQNIPDTPPVVEGKSAFTSGTASKRDTGIAISNKSLSKRATLVVDVYYDLNGAGRHEGLYTDTQRCYNLGNGWNDQITSLRVPNGFGCIFYRNNGCGVGDYRLTVPGGNFIPDLRTYNFDDIISSYLCYN